MADYKSQDQRRREYPTINQAVTEKRNENPWGMEPKRGSDTSEKYDDIQHKLPTKEKYTNVMKRDDIIKSRQWSKNPKNSSNPLSSSEKDTKIKKPTTNKPKKIY